MCRDSHQLSSAHRHAASSPQTASRASATRIKPVAHVGRRGSAGRRVAPPAASAAACHAGAWRFGVRSMGRLHARRARGRRRPRRVCRVAPCGTGDLGTATRRVGREPPALRPDAGVVGPRAPASQRLDVARPYPEGRPPAALLGVRLGGREARAGGDPDDAHGRSAEALRELRAPRAEGVRLAPLARVLRVGVAPPRAAWKSLRRPRGGVGGRTGRGRRELLAAEADRREGAAARAFTEARAGLVSRRRRAGGGALRLDPRAAEDQLYRERDQGDHHFAW